VRQPNICAETLSADLEWFVELLQSLIKNEGVSYEQFYSCDKTNLNFKMLLSKTSSWLQKKERTCDDSHLL
jgi:hypothetical protein